MKTTKLTFILTLLMMLLGTNAFAAKKDKNTVEQEWYLRLTVEVPSQNMKDRGNVLGHLYDSKITKDSHDLIEMAPFGDNYLTIVFPHPEWGEDAGDYTSDYHHPDAYNADEWTFEVRSSAVNSDVKLYWEGLYVLSTSSDGKKLKKKEELVINTLLQRMWLEDAATGKRIEAVVDNNMQSYTFNMNGSNVRTFRWGIGNYTKTKNEKSTTEDKVTVKPSLPEQANNGQIGKPGQPK